MRLYHGSNMEVSNPKILPATRNVDFGNGFYLTTDFEQAKKWSKSTARRRGVGIPIVSVFEIGEDDLNNLRIKVFKEASEEWLNFVSENRKKLIYNNEYDIIMGPVADDNTMPVVDLYMQGFLDVKDAIKRLLPQKLKNQVVFKNEFALSKLKFIERIEIAE